MKPKLKNRIKSFLIKGGYKSILNLLQKKAVKNQNDIELLFNVAMYSHTIARLSKSPQKRSYFLNKAKNNYKKIIMLAPYSQWAYHGKARWLAEKRKFKESLKFYKKVYEVMPTYENALHVGNAYLASNKNKDAIRYFLIANKKRGGYASFQLATTYHKTGDHTKARFWGRKALKQLLNKKESRKEQWCQQRKKNY